MTTGFQVIHCLNNADLQYSSCNIKRICQFLTEYSTHQRVQATVLFLVDYCNSLLVGLLACAIHPLCRWSRMQLPEVFTHYSPAENTPLATGHHKDQTNLHDTQMHAYGGPSGQNPHTSRMSSRSMYRPKHFAETKGHFMTPAQRNKRHRTPIKWFFSFHALQ